MTPGSGEEVPRESPSTLATTSAALRTGAPVRRRGPRWFLAVLVAHAALTTGALALSFSLSMSRFDTGVEATWLERVAHAILAVLSFPLLTLLGHLSDGARWFPGLAGWLPVALNSAVWAAAIFRVDRWLGSRFERRRGSAGAPGR